MKKIILTLLFVLIGTLSAEDIFETIKIIPGAMTPIDDSGNLPIVGFAPVDSPTVAFSRMIIFMTVGERLNLSVINNDNEVHGFRWTFGGSDVTILPDDTAEVIFEPSAPGAYPFSDNTNYPFNIARGLSGVVIAKDAGDNFRDFVWFLNDHDEEWLIALDQGESIDPATYKADYFTINGNSFPNTLSDTLAAVTGVVNETINIWIINGGLQVHSIHFHGYHATLLSQNGNPYPQPYSKDTFPGKQGVGIHTTITPWQPGTFPVHDHSLTAVTAKGFYPNGMLVYLNISE